MVTDSTAESRAEALRAERWLAIGVIKSLQGTPEDEDALIRVQRTAMVEILRETGHWNPALKATLDALLLLPRTEIPRPPPGTDWLLAFDAAFTIAREAQCPYCERFGLPYRPGGEQTRTWWHEMPGGDDQLCEASALLTAYRRKRAEMGPAR